MSPGLPTRLVQLRHPEEGRRAALVYGNELHLLASYRSVYSFARAALETGWKLRDLLSTDLSGIVLDYEQVYSLATAWRFLPSFDQPDAPGRCLVSVADGGTSRYRGYGAILRGHGEPLIVLASAPMPRGDVAAIYIIGEGGTPRRVGLTPGNVSRLSAIGPELTLDPDPEPMHGALRLLRAGREISFEALGGGHTPLLLALAAVEAEYFESGDHRSPGDTHVLFLGERLFGARDAVPVKDGDQAWVEFPRLGSALRNSLQVEQPVAHPVAAVPL